MTAIYCSTKAALHSYTQSMRYRLKGNSVKVLELAPPWVRTDLMNSREAEQAIPLDQFIAEAMGVFATGADEILVESAKPFRANVGPNEHGFVDAFNAQMLSLTQSG